MGLKELLNTAISKIANDDPNGIKTVLESALGEANALLDSQEELRNDSKSYKSRLRESERKANELQNELDKQLASKTDLSELQIKADKYEALLAEQVRTKTETWEKKAEIFATPETSKLYPLISKIKPQFAFPKDKEALSEQQIDENLKLMATLEAAGAFELQSSEAKAFPNPAFYNKTDVEMSSGAAILQRMKNKR